MKDTVVKIERLVVADFVPVAPVHVGQAVPDDVGGEEEPGLELAHGLVVRLRLGHLAHVHAPGGDHGGGKPCQTPRHHQGSVGDQEEQLVARQVRLALIMDDISTTLVTQESFCQLTMCLRTSRISVFPEEDFSRYVTSVKCGWSVML